MSVSVESVAQSLRIDYIDYNVKKHIKEKICSY